jgi:hypothetical protein
MSSASIQSLMDLEVQISYMYASAAGNVSATSATWHAFNEFVEYWFLPDIPTPANIFEKQHQSSHLPNHAPYNSSYNSSIYAQRLEPSICPECLQTQIRTSQQTLLGDFR